MAAPVLFIINSLTGGGAERVMATLLAHSQSRSAAHEIHLALLDREPAAYAAPDWLPVHQLDARGSLLASVRQLRALAGRLRPTATLSFLTRANLANHVAMAGTGRPWLISERVDTAAHFGRGPGAAVKRAMVRASYPKATRVIAVSQGVAEGLRRKFGVPEDRLIVIDNPVDLDAIRARAAEAPAIEVEPPYVMGMGRLAPNKNFALLIEAFAASAMPGRLLIVGDGPERAALERQAAELGVANRVLMPGFVDNPFALLRRADLFVLPSNAEGFPNSLVEAMAVGRPVVATNCASGPSQILAHSPREAIRDLTFARHGVLTPPNDLAAMTAALRAMDGPKRAHYAEAARVRAQDFGADRAAAAYWAAIEGALA